MPLRENIMYAQGAPHGCQAAVKIETAACLIITSWKKKKSPNQGQQTVKGGGGDVVTRVTPCLRQGYSDSGCARRTHVRTVNER